MPVPQAPQATDHSILIKMSQAGDAPLRRRPQLVVPAPPTQGMSRPPSRPRRPHVPAHAPRSARPRPALQIGDRPHAVVLPALASDTARLTGLRQDVFAQDAIRLPGAPPSGPSLRGPSLRGFGTPALSALASPVIGTVLLGLLAGLKLG